MFEASAYEVHASAYFSRNPYSCPTQPVASDTMADWRERRQQQQRARIARESSAGGVAE